MQYTVCYIAKRSALSCFLVLTISTDFSVIQQKKLCKHLSEVLAKMKKKKHTFLAIIDFKCLGYN